MSSTKFQRGKTLMLPHIAGFFAEWGLWQAEDLDLTETALGTNTAKFAAACGLKDGDIAKQYRAYIHSQPSRLPAGLFAELMGLSANDLRTNGKHVSNWRSPQEPAWTGVGYQKELWRNTASKKASGDEVPSSTCFQKGTDAKNPAAGGYQRPCAMSCAQHVMAFQLDPQSPSYGYTEGLGLDLPLICCQIAPVELSRPNGCAGQQKNNAVVQTPDQIEPSPLDVR